MTSQESSGSQPLGLDYFLDTYGLGPEEIETTITFGTYTGTVAEMLVDERCPVGNIVADAYATEGIAGVEAKLTGMRMVYGDFKLDISETTRSYHSGASDRETILQRSSSGEPDFLAR